MNPLVLYVDNDIANLVVFESSLEGVLPYRTATHSGEALEILGSEEIGVLLMGVPGASRADLLDVVRREHPDTIRMVLSEDPARDSRSEVLETGRADYLLQNPWNAKELRFALEAALDRYRMARRLRELETKLLSAERIYSLGVAAAELAHEIRNPLSSLMSNLRVASGLLASLEQQVEPSGDAQLRKTIAEVLSVLADCSQATDAILDITRSVELASRGRAEPELLDLEELVRLVLRSLRAKTVRYGAIDLQAESVPPIRGSRTRLGQVMTNLVLNGLQAAASVTDRPARVSVRLWHENEEVFLEVKDNGPGIEPEIQSRIFEPFFTTKEGGTGLGLAITRRIVEEHQGRIQVFSKRHGGTRFLVTLPTLRNH